MRDQVAGAGCVFVRVLGKYRQTGEVAAQWLCEVMHEHYSTADETEVRDALDTIASAIRTGKRPVKETTE